MNTDNSIEIQHLCPPLSSSECMEIVEFLWHKGEPWIGDIHRRLQADITGALDTVLVARKGRALVGHVWYTLSVSDLRLGLIGHIDTAPPYRRQGISASLLDAAMIDFRQRGGQLMQLFTSTPYMLKLYQRFGFENLYSNQTHHDTDWYMCCPAGSHAKLCSELGSVRGEVQPLAAGMLPQYCFLYNQEHDRLLKDRAQQIGLGLEAELAFIQTRQKLEAGQSTCFALGDQHLITGIATLSRLSFPHQSHIGILDIHVDRRFANRIPELIDACLAQRDHLGIEIVYGMAVDSDKRHLFGRLGFKPITALPGHFHIAGKRHDLHVFQLDT